MEWNRHDRIACRVNTLLKSVIGVMAAALVVSAGAGGHGDSWNRFMHHQRITAVAETTGHLFKALHNLRYDRSNTNRDLLADRQFSSVSSLIKTAREHEIAALKAALVSLATVEFADRQTAIADLSSRLSRLLALQDESAAALLKPKSERRADIAKDYMSETGTLLAALDKLSGQLNQLVKLQDSFIDQMMTLKQLAWIMRNASGDASLGVTNALAGLPIPPDAMALYTGHVGKTDGAWAALEDLVAGMSLPAGLKASIDTVKREFFGRDYLDLRTKYPEGKDRRHRPRHRHGEVDAFHNRQARARRKCRRKRARSGKGSRSDAALPPLSNRWPCKADF